MFPRGAQASRLEERLRACLPQRWAYDDLLFPQLCNPGLSFLILLFHLCLFLPLSLSISLSPPSLLLSISLPSLSLSVSISLFSVSLSLSLSFPLSLSVFESVEILLTLLNSPQLLSRNTSLAAFVSKNAF